MYDLHNNIDILRVISPVAVGTTGTGQTGKIIDRAGYEAVEFGLAYGSVTATSATITPVVKHGDATGSMTSVADADLIGTEAGAGIAAAATRTSGVSKHIAKRLGYKGVKRYVSVNLVSTISAGPVVSAVAILGKPRSAPVAT